MIKHTFTLYPIVFLLFLSLFSCNTIEEKAFSPSLIPTPQQLDIEGVSHLSPGDILTYYLTGGTELPVLEELTGLAPKTDQATAQVKLIIDGQIEIDPEGYYLTIHENLIEIKAADKEGLLYGMMTLRQLMQDAKVQNVNLPMCSIKDYPLLAYRAIHLDVKHHMEKKDYYFKLMDRLVSYKINGVILELEDKLDYSRSSIGSEDAWSIDEWKELSLYAKARNIEISPLVQGLGHASFILKHDEYKHLRDDLKSDWAFNPLDPETYELQFDLYEEALEATPYGNYLHIGGDEVHTTGRGSGQSPLALQLIWLNKVCQYAKENDRTPIFWDDMPLAFSGVYRTTYDTSIPKEKVDSIWQVNETKLVEFIDQFPRNCIYMRWNYGRPETYGNQKAMDWFTSNGFQVMGATAGQTRWILMPQNQSNIPSIKSFAQSSIEKGLNGLLLTLWDDDSPHFELYMRGILAFAKYCWAGDSREVESMKELFNNRFFGVELAEANFIDKLELIAGKWKNLLVANGNRNDLVSNQFKGLIDIPDPNNKGVWSEKYSDRLELAREILSQSDSIGTMIKIAKNTARRNHYTLQVYEQVNNLINYTAQMLLTLEAFDKSTQEYSDRLSAISGLQGQFGKMRSTFEEVYGKTRILTKPEGYILDQDHHQHSANQTRSYDWQFIAEIALLNKVDSLVKVMD